MDPFDAPEPVALLQSSLEKPTSLSRPTLVPDVAAYVPPSLPEELEEAFFDTLPPPPERSDRDWEDDVEVVPRRRWGERLFLGAAGVLVLGALGAAAWTVFKPGLEPVIYPESEVIGDVSHGDSTAADRSERRVRRKKRSRPRATEPAAPQALPKVEAREPLRASDLKPATSVSALPPAD